MAKTTVVESVVNLDDLDNDTGNLTPEELEGLKDLEGVSFDDVDSELDGSGSESAFTDDDLGSFDQQLAAFDDHLSSLNEQYSGFDDEFESFDDDVSFNDDISGDYSFQEDVPFDLSDEFLKLRRQNLNRLSLIVWEN